MSVANQPQSTSSRWFLFGGWALPPQIPGELFAGYDVQYVDINELLPLIVSQGALRSHWIQILIEALGQRYSFNQKTSIAGWSTGALVAAAIASRFEPRNLILLSATPSFCIRPGFRMGQRVSILRQMRMRFSENREEVLRNFALQCEVPPHELSRFAQEGMRYSNVNLDAGLVFLSEVDLRWLPPLINTRVTLFHGSDDRVIPPAAGESLALQLNGSFVNLPGAHLFFLDPDNREIIRKTIGDRSN